MLDISGGVMERAIRPSPVCRVGIADIVAVYVLAASSIDADVEAWIAARSAGLSVAELACGQVCLGIPAVLRPSAICAVEWVRGRSSWVTGLSVETLRIAAWYISLTMKIGTMAAGALLKIRQIERLRTMLSIPFLRMGFI